MPELVWEVTEFEPETSFSWTSVTAGVTTVGGHRVSVTDDGVTVTLSIDQRGFLAPLVWLLTSRRTRRSMQMEADGLKHSSEARS
jgi:hypothetical protein